jgi:hypothetical protein
MARFLFIGLRGRASMAESVAVEKSGRNLKTINSLPEVHRVLPELRANASDTHARVINCLECCLPFEVAGVYSGSSRLSGRKKSHQAKLK